MRDSFDGIHKLFVRQRLENNIAFFGRVSQAIKEDLSFERIAHTDQNADKNPKAYLGGKSGGECFHWGILLPAHCNIESEKLKIPVFDTKRSPLARGWANLPALSAGGLAQPRAGGQRFT